MSNTPDPTLPDKLAGLVVAVRSNSRRGKLTTLSECWEGPPEGLFARISYFLGEIGDVESIREGEIHYLFSTKFMTRRYAESAALALTGEAAMIIARTVRYESATYPRPTLVELFGQHPYSLPPADIEAAIADMVDSAAYPDIGAVTASDGSTFLFSAEHLTLDRAQSLAEWIAVGDSNNP